MQGLRQGKFLLFLSRHIIYTKTYMSLGSAGHSDLLLCRLACAADGLNLGFGRNRVICGQLVILLFGFGGSSNNEGHHFFV
jgi:hypothetical protein